MGVSVRARSATRSPSPDAARRKRGHSPDGAPRARVSRFDTGATPPGAKRRRNASPSPPRRFVPPPRDVAPPPPMRRPVSPPRRATPPLMDDPLDGARALLEILPSAQSFNGALGGALFVLMTQVLTSRLLRSWTCLRHIRSRRRRRGWTPVRWAAVGLGLAVGVDGDDRLAHACTLRTRLSGRRSLFRPFRPVAVPYASAVVTLVPHCCALGCGNASDSRCLHASLSPLTVAVSACLSGAAEPPYTDAFGC